LPSERHGSLDARKASLKKRANMSNTSQSLLDRYMAISRAVAGQLDFQQVLQRVAGEIRGLIAYDHMDISVIFADTRDCCVAYEVGVTTGWGEEKLPKPIERSPIRELLKGEVDYILTGDAWEEPRFHFAGAFDAPIFEARLHSRLHVPFRVHGTIHGALNISSHEKHRYSDRDVATAREIADLLAPYVYAVIRSEEARKLALSEGAARGREEALRLGALRLTEGMENERKRLGMDLHDQTLADLARVSRQLSTLSRQPTVRTSDLAQLDREIATCITELRRIIEDTKPGILELFGFSQAVEAQLERSVATVLPPIRTAVTDTTASLLDKGPEPLRQTLFRIVQEAINNAVKHGKACRINVSIDVSGTHLIITVEDDGTGPAGNWDRSSGGVDNMKVRARLISAKIVFERSAEDSLTRVVISLPLSRLARETGGIAQDVIRRPNLGGLLQQSITPEESGKLGKDLMAQ
jgi:signal transduction histidine kinase